MCRIRKNAFLTLILSLGLLLSGCSSLGLAQERAFESEYDKEAPTPVNIFVSSAEMVFKGIDYSSSQAVFTDTETGEIRSFEYDGATVINDQYSQPMSIGMLQAGDVVNIAYNGEYNKIGAIVLSPAAFKYEDVTKYSLSENGETFYIGDEAFSIGNGTQVLSNGENIEINQLINHDRLTIQGNGRDIYSIRVDDGHGYLKLVNEDALIGGWVEVGQAVISQVMSDMLFTVPEGQYQVRLSNTGIEEYREISIKRNEVTELNLEDIVSPLPEKGMVSFVITPSNANVFVDGMGVNTAYSMKFPIGYHEITVSASGYPTVTQYFEVTGINQRVEVDLSDKINSTPTGTSTISGNSIAKNLYATVTIEAPRDVEVYEDNIYKGISPVTYQKTAGTHVITLYKKGYVTNSYSITLYEDGKDETLKFPELDEEGYVPGASPSPSPKNTVSGNSLASPSGSPSASPSLSPSPSPTPIIVYESEEKETEEERGTFWLGEGHIIERSS